MPETDSWVKDQLLSQAQAQTEILTKLSVGHERMEKIDNKLNNVLEATQGFETLKIDVDQLKKAEDLREKAEQLKVEEELRELKEENKEKQAVWGDRLWSLFIACLPYIIILIGFIYTLKQ